MDGWMNGGRLMDRWLNGWISDRLINGEMADGVMDR